MRTLATMTLAVPLLAAFGPAQTRQITLARTGKTGKPVPQGADSDQVWYDAGSNSYYFAHVGAVSVVNAATETFVEDIRFEDTGVHSVAVDAKNHHIFVPVNGKGIFVVAPGG